ncbi:LPS biosynthesis protein [Vibrio nigripulchritudo]|uniref:lipopolysaccharide biosynthesis protein n=1 Tax=Vibrio nigripulchritudo TaxID=28173 RepID=UPI00190D56EF|nr:lipopolysaccharide biosynthesis protein [Vibrio nigripulchritudo]BCL70396.1 LPS biosynthesis protein [Vibrio nigripulchritudo]BDU31749.1 LPS biosynthesis protein [Vibrio nigripulchritudo]
MRALTQSAYYAVGIIMMKGVSLMMIPYLTRKLSLSEYGSLEALLLLADIGTIVFSFGLVNAMYRYVGTAKGEEKRTLISNCFSLSAIFCVLGALLLIATVPLLVTLLPVVVSEYQILLLAVPTLLDGLITIPLTLMRMNELAKRFCVLNVGKALGQAFLMFVLLELGYGIDAVLISGAVSSSLLLLCLFGYQWQQMGRFGYLKHSKMLLQFSLPTLAGFLSMYMITGLDRWLLASYVGVEELAVYAIAVKFALILGLVLQPYSLWWFPNRISLLQQPDGKQICADKAMLGTNLGIFFGLGMILTVPGFIAFALPESYQLSSTIVVALLAINIIKNAGDYLNLGCYSGDSSQAQMWIQGICAVVATAGYFIFVPIYGLWGVVAVLGSAYTMRLLLLYSVSQSMEYLPYNHSKWILSTMLSVVAWGVYQWLVKLLSAVPEIVMGTGVGLGVSVAFIYLKILPVPEALLCKLSLRKPSSKSVA